MQPSQLISLVSVLLQYLNSTVLPITNHPLSVATTLTSVMVTRTSFDSCMHVVNYLLHDAPSHHHAPAVYEVFYQVTGMSITRLSGGTTSNTVLTLTGLSLGSHSIFVVGSGAAGDHVLPSDHAAQ